MFFSVNASGFRSRHRLLEKFVLNWRTRGLPPRYRFDLVLVRGRYFRSAGAHGIVELATRAPFAASEIAHFPFAVRLILSDGDRLPRLGPIEHFADYGPNEQADVWLTTVSGHVATKFPGDYRSPAQVEREASSG